MTELRSRGHSGVWPQPSQIREQLQATLSGTHTLERELGGGGMSRVFLAEEVRLRRKVAVKILSPELAQGLNIDRFEREIQTAAALQQANIVPVLSAGESDGLPFYTMPFVEGESLRARLARGPLSISEAIGILRDVSKALAFAHARGVVHRDIKPDNVLLSGGTAVVTDFGIAKALTAAREHTGDASATLTQVGTSIGTPAYMAPEQAAGDPDVDHRADIYAYGAMAYELLCGHAVFAGRTPQRMLVAHMSELPKPIGEARADVPPALSALVMACLAKDANDRPQNTNDVTRLLDAITSGSSMQVMPSALIGGARMFRRALAVYAVACVIVPLVAKAATVSIGLPDWVFTGSILVMAMGLPVVLWTGYVERVAHRALTATPTLTPGGSKAVERGTMAIMALKAAPKVSWARTARGGVVAFGVFVIVIAAVMAMRSMGIGPFGSLVASGALHDQDKVMVADFTASNGDRALGRVVSDAMRTGLSDSRVMKIMTPADIGSALQRMKQPTDSRVDFSLARQIALREGVKAIVDGEVTTVGSSYIVSARLVTADSARELAVFQATASNSNAIIDVADKLSRKLRAKAGESLRGVQNATPLAYATTSSLDALRKYSEAVREADINRDYIAAIALHREAIALDSTFGEAYRKMAVAMRNSQAYPRSAIDSAMRKAFSFKDRMLERDRDLMFYSYYIGSPGFDRGKAEQAIKRMLARGDSQFVVNNLGFIYNSRREYARAESLYRTAVHRSYSPVLASTNLQLTLRRQGKFDAYDSSLADGIKRFPGNPAVGRSRFEAMADRGRFQAALSALDSAKKSADDRRIANLYAQAADLALVLGRAKDHRADYRKAVTADSAIGATTPRLQQALVYLMDALDLHVPTESYVAEIDSLLTANNIESLPVADRPYLQLAYLNAKVGRVDRAKQFLARYESAVTDTAMRRWMTNDVLYARSAIHMAEGNWKASIASLRQAYRRPDGFGAPSFVQIFNRHEMEQIDIFATANQPDSALAVFEAYLKSPEGSAKREGPNMWMGAGRYEAIAKMYDAKGNVPKAIENYQAMIDLWKNADAELQPRVAAARVRLQQLAPVEKTGQSLNVRK